jgi:hypothetical protein
LTYLLSNSLFNDHQPESDIPLSNHQFLFSCVPSAASTSHYSRFEPSKVTNFVFRKLQAVSKDPVFHW